MHQSARRLGYLTSSSPRRQERPPIVPSKPVLAQKILQASREAENALADALVKLILIEMISDSNMLTLLEFNSIVPRRRRFIL